MRRAALSLLLPLAACGGDARPGGEAPPRSGADLTGAGATFPYPLYSRWFADWAARSGTRINYQSIGSGGGIRQLAAGTVDFGATDVPMTDAEVARLAPRRVLHVPTVLGAVAITYNLPGLARPLRLSGEVIAALFDGRIRRWNDPRLAALNPGVPLPARDVLVVVRADGGGTTYIFSDYLAAVSPAWAARGPSKDVRWPVGIGGRGNEGVAGQVKAMPGSVGYVEAVYARQNLLPVAHVQNRAGRFVGAELDAIAEAGATATAAATGNDFRRSIVNAPGDRSYPISSFTWLLLPITSPPAAPTPELARFLGWALREGGEVARSLGYVPLPVPVRDRLLPTLDSLAGPEGRP